MDEDEIVMTPVKKGKATSIRIERQRRQEVDRTAVHHKAGGQHSGLVVNKQQQGASNASTEQAQLQLEFTCFLVNQRTGDRFVERRQLRYWFQDDADHFTRMNGAYEFFKELVRPDTFPRDYVGFIKKSMKQMQSDRYRQIRKVDVELEPLGNDDNPLPSPGLPKQDDRAIEEIVREQLLQTLESAYPNILAMDDLMRLLETDEATILSQLEELKAQNLIKEMEVGGFMREVLDRKTEVKMVKQMPVITGGSKPTVAIITAAYAEKLAVDAMMTHKTTFVKYKTEGESNVYTIGIIGEHKVISTKLPTVGRQRAAKISSGNTTTRLLGTFADVEHVFMVGGGGGCPHMADYFKHPRLGDIVVSTPNSSGNMYVFCDSVHQKQESGELVYKNRYWKPLDATLQNIVAELSAESEANPDQRPWDDFIIEGQKELDEQQADFTRPPANTDRLFMSIGGSEVIEVAHPACPPDAVAGRRDGFPTVRRGCIGAGRPVTKDETLRQDFAARHEILAYDTEFDQVLESIVGNRKDSFLFVRGVVDYQDGQKNKEWQPYASLAAAAYMKAVLCRLPGDNRDD
ncbi:uncharacterized protein LOC141906767 isoform X2 [Tubulanus polymorphus]|uniref:uncharacterized protein LOC141906767 isoform X2 n=1 Tax=Tubulanus polymorphus TaxID=672921 RepID=UPI003DA4548D